MDFPCHKEHFYGSKWVYKHTYEQYNIEDFSHVVPFIWCSLCRLFATQTKLNLIKLVGHLPMISPSTYTTFIGLSCLICLVFWPKSYINSTEDCRLLFALKRSQITNTKKSLSFYFFILKRATRTKSCRHHYRHFLVVHPVYCSYMNGWMNLLGNN